jgi:hypothetical protein
MHYVFYLKYQRQKKCIFTIHTPTEIRFEVHWQKQDSDTGVDEYTYKTSYFTYDTVLV